MPLNSSERSARYRAKDVLGYRIRKAEYARTPEQREKRRQYMIQWRERNRDRFNEIARDGYKRNRDKLLKRSKEYHYSTKYGLSIDAKAEMVERQGFKCLICDSGFKSERDKHVDHCHTTGVVRGILCHVCNTRLGWYERHAASVKSYLDTNND